MRHKRSQNARVVGPLVEEVVVKVESVVMVYLLSRLNFCPSIGLTESE
jgi:hypothetical protein